jgi:hypothetical protein
VRQNLSIRSFVFVRTKLKVCPYSFRNMSIRILFVNHRLHDEELVDVSSLTWSSKFLIMQRHVPYLVFTLYSSIYMTMTTRCRNYDTLASWLWKLCVFTMKILSHSYETETSWPGELSPIKICVFCEICEKIKVISYRELGSSRSFFSLADPADDADLTQIIFRVIIMLLILHLCYLWNLCAK